MKVAHFRHLMVFLGIAIAFTGLVICLFLFHPRPKPKVSLSFYSWQNRFELDSSTNAFLQRHRINHLRVKLFELSLDDKSNSAVVNNYVQPRSNGDFFIQNTLTPVVFIDNKIFYSIDSTEIREMAGLVKRALIIHSANLFNPYPDQWPDIWEQLYFSLGMSTSSPDSLNKAYQQFKQNIVSYEFDCDWTVKTQKKYFYFLQQVKDSLQKKTEATLRLHQYKYRGETGIPPVDGVNLMCYNMGELNDKKEKNSIFSTEILREYIKGQSPYPLPMNIALPSFSWVVVFRNNQFYKLIPGNDLRNYLEENYSSYNIEKIDASNFLVRNDFSYDWTAESLQQGDQLRLEKVDNQVLLQGYNMLLKELPKAPSEVIIFDLNNTKRTEDFDELAKHINP